MKDDIYYKAMLARDYRFDGKFFVGVKTTGIYCRPICPARPKRENVEFFTTSLAAEKAGYRPCLRCRPESAPLSPAWFGKSAVVQRALRVIAADGFFDSNEDEFAGQFGVSARHLRRLFVEEVGLTPKQIAFNNRLGFARKLIVESHLPMTSVAMTAGFASLRRFNDAFKKRFHREPRALRRAGASKNPHDSAAPHIGVTLSLAYRPPYDWATILAFYRTHLIFGLETVTENSYERVFRMGKSIGVLAVKPEVEITKKGVRHAPPQLALTVSVDDPSYLFAISQRVRRMFDLDSDPLLIANSFRSEPLLNSLAKKYPGLRLARGWDPFETAVCTILGQLVSVTYAQELKRQLVENYGEKFFHPLTGAEVSLFPDAEKLASCDLSRVKTTVARRKAIRALAKLVISRKLDLVQHINADIVKEKLLEVPGLGPWSAEYISLRALGDTDAFPATDLVLKRALKQHPYLDLEKVRPWRSYAAIYLWKKQTEMRQC